jgi:predicted RNA methylase
LSQGPSGYERIPHEKYQTPSWVTEALMRAEKFEGDVLDPCAGAGHMMAVLRDYAGAIVTGIDTSPDPSPFDLEITAADFLTHEGEYDAVVANPPYGKQGKLAEKFIMHALELTRSRKGKVAMLLRVDFDSAKTRKKMFKDHVAYSAKYPILQRIHWVNVPVKYDKHGRKVQPTDNHSWFVWSWRSPDFRYEFLP